MLYAALAPHPITIGDGEVTADRWFLFVTYAPILRLPEFLIGCVLGRMFLDGRRQPATAAALFGLLVLGVTTATVPEPLIRVAAIPLMGLLVLSLATGIDAISRQLARPWLVALGEASYGLYILQAPLWFWTVRVVGLPGLTERLVFLVLLIGAALASYWWLETPLRRAIVRLHESCAQLWAQAQLSL